MFIKDQTINWWNLSDIDDCFDCTETDVNKYLRMQSPDMKDILFNQDIFYTFCGC